MEGLPFAQQLAPTAQRLRAVAAPGLDPPLSLDTLQTDDKNPTQRLTTNQWREGEEPQYRDQYFDCWVLQRVSSRSQTSHTCKIKSFQLGDTTYQPLSQSKEKTQKPIIFESNLNKIQKELINEFQRKSYESKILRS